EVWSLPAQSRLSGSKSHVLHVEGADLIVAGLQGGRFGVGEPSAGGVTVTSVSCTHAGKQLAHGAFVQAACVGMPQAQAARVVDAGLVLLAADAFGGASQCVSMAVSYAKERQQFGKPIGAFQAVKHQLADMALAVEPAIGLYWYAAHAFDTGAAD